MPPCSSRHGKSSCSTKSLTESIGVATTGAVKVAIKSPRYVFINTNDVSNHPPTISRFTLPTRPPSHQVARF